MIKNATLIVLVLFVGLSAVNGQSLDSILQLVVENNPELSALQSEYKAELLKVDQVRMIPNTKLGIGVPLLRPETRLGPQIMMVSASQMFPWFGTRESKENVVISMSKAKFERISAVRLELFNKVEVAYYELIFLKSKEEIITKMLQQFKALERISLSKLESGSGRMSNVLRVQLKQDELSQLLQRIELSKEKSYATINSLTKQPWTTVIDVTDDEPTLLYEFSLEEQRKKISQHYPLIQLIDRQIETSKNKQLVAKKQGAPMIGVGLDYIIVGERTDMNPEHNGRDILVPKFMISIPLYRKAYKAKIQEETIIQEGLEYRKEAIEQRIIGQLLKHNTDYELALLDIELNEQQVNTTQQILKLLLTEYSTGVKNFDELIGVQNQLLKYEIELSKTEKMAQVAISNMKRLINY